ncbi:hypothetical protein HY009_10385, partial [Candidatus Acetothermia bacterium]|nr:hypothetical protein [Candidatus Acetothermia bacterium]
STPRLGSVDSGANLYIGRRQVPSPVFFDGAIDEVEIYNRSFGLVDAQAIFNAGSAGHCR